VTFLAKTIQASLLAVGLIPAGAAWASSISGPYLAARQASFLGDFESAAHYYGRVLGVQPDRAEVLERAVLANISLGRVDVAASLADKLVAQGQNSELANMALVSRAVANADYDAVLKAIADQRALGPLADGLIKGWAQIGQGDRLAALKSFAAIGEIQGLGPFARYHQALALAGDGQFDAAADLMTPEQTGGLSHTRRGILAQVQILSQLGRAADAQALISENFGVNLDPELNALMQALEAGTTQPYTITATVRDGVAEVFFSLAGALASEGNDDLTLLYARMAQYLRPDHVPAILLAADLLDDLDQHELAAKTFAQVPESDPSYHVAVMGQAEALQSQDQVDQAADLLRGLTRSHGDLPLVHATLGDLLRQAEDFPAASDAYTEALARYDELSRREWIIFYARGITYERQDLWDKAEADFRKALELNPDHPSVLNYLGYSLVEHESKLDEALDMIERAVAARPNSGYIDDSLGWALFRLGRYEEAVPHMETAAEIMSVDPVVNDHLGDVYGAVGRKREAEFMWKRALAFVDWDGAVEEVDPERLRRKLDVGLDTVLEEEGAQPLHRADD
jgi:tetratricopeptide (TPR) repeat protein